MRETQSLRRRLSEEQMQERGIELGARLDKVESLTKEKKAISDDLTEKIKGEAGRIKELREIMRTQSELGDVDCMTVPYRSAGVMVTVRLDTGEEVGRRPMTDAEKIPNLFEAEEHTNGQIKDPESDEAIEFRIQKTVELVDQLEKLELNLATANLWPLPIEQVEEGLTWASKAIEAVEGKARKKPKTPEFLTKLADRRAAEEAERREREDLKNRAIALMKDAGETVDEVLLASLGVDDLNAVSDYAQQIIDAKASTVEGDELPTFERPTCLPPLPGPPESGDDAAAS